MRLNEGVKLCVYFAVEYIFIVKDVYIKMFRNRGRASENRNEGSPYFP